MEMFTEATSYATRANALKKLNTELGDNIGNYRWMIATNEEGRFIPVVLGIDNVHLAYCGLCVAG